MTIKPKGNPKRQKEVKMEILDLLKEKKISKVTELLDDMNNVDIAALLQEIDLQDAIKVFRLLKTDDAAEVFSYIEPEKQKEIIEVISEPEINKIIDELFIDDTVDIIEAMPANVVKKILKSAKPDLRREINKFLAYPDNSAGSIMTPEFLDLRLNMTVNQALERIRKIGDYKETVNSCYVLDATKHLIGVLSIKELLLSQPDVLIDDIMETNVIFCNTLTDQEEVTHIIKKYDLLCIPVVDAEKRMVAIIKIDDIIDVNDEEATEDIQKMAAITPSDTPYLKTSVWRIWLNRVPWLLILMVSATFTGIIINKNEEMLNLPTIGIILTGCIPMLMDTGGNAGSQASVTVIRSIALGEVTIKDIFKVIFKELRVSVLLGATLAVACFGKLMLIDRLYAVQPHGFLVALVICLTMFITIVIAKLIGCSLPLVAKACKLDPAVVASPFITTIVDALSLIIYCGISVAVLGQFYQTIL